MKKSRRQFILQSAMAASALSVQQSSFASTGSVYNSGNKMTNEPLKISVFSKGLHWLDWTEMAAVVKEMGYDGIDLTVRPEGHVLPERVGEDLPKAMGIIRKAGLEVNMITTAISTAAEPYTIPILKTASQLGIRHYRLNWFPYDKKISMPDNLEKFKRQLSELAQLNKKYGVHGDYQNHAGDSFGAAVIDLWTVLKDIDPQWIGCQYDIRHATVEGANSWPVGLSFLKDHIMTINLKDFQWVKKEGEWKVENVPLGEGLVNFTKYAGMLRTINYNGPVCLHQEYELGGAERGAKKLTILRTIVLEAMKKDLVTARKMLAVT